jgi:hypothetical protein
MYIAVAIVLLVVLAIVVVLLLAATKPRIFRVQRQANVNAGPDKLFPYINDFHKWAEWSPYEKLDPGMKRTFRGNASGKGAIYEWEGNSKAGKGRMEILESAPSARISIKLDFIKPFEGHNIAEFVMAPSGDSTEITWSMHGPATFMARIFHVFINMDSMIGKDFQTGLNNLKAITEK